MKTNEAIRSQVCEHCCYELVCSSNRLTEEFKEYLYVTYLLVLLIVTGLVYGAASLFFFLCWIFPALGGHRRPGQEDDADPYEKDRARIQEKSQRLGAKVNYHAGRYYYDTAHQHCLDDDLIANINSINARINDPGDDPGKYESTMVAIQNELIDRRRQREKQNEALKELDR